MKGLEGLRGIGALDLNTQHCDERQRNFHEPDRLRIQYEQKKVNERAPVTGIVIRKCKILFEAYKVCSHV